MTTSVHLDAPRLSRHSRSWRYHSAAAARGAPG